ncbi:aldehyde dehydrogenase family protein [Novosphingobium cyanobacteriorum]|uniref:Aldehyde dehydrogenase family protein n=1 Tax=Novosphingobium cyanobacteriorum TaxID=3024215 RepID=A0ABT6CF87_9SPHN|nr:aldehyde dehydrogenase family protein [Novosphingobium cyanobacteriorum]MDF8332209.1 aldehyde dehydrogenase family protein [Novosphingobium cyanobacteriorum]
MKLNGAIRHRRGEGIVARFFDDFSMTIDGKAAASPTTLDVLNPATEEVVASVPDCTREQLDASVAAARKAFPGWRDTPISERRRALVKFAEVIAAHADDFARLFTLEQGRPLAGARMEIDFGAYWAAEMAKMEIPVTVTEDSQTRYSETHHTPLGVVAGIVPWNFPFNLALWKIAPALLTGNTLVLKPSPFTPLTMLKLAELMREHLPAGVFNVVSGGDRLGPWLTAHPDVDKISFTGSTATGKKVMEAASAGLKRVTLELGGNDAAIVLPDVNVDEIADQLFFAAFGNSGQICIATKRMYIHEDVYDRVAEALAMRARHAVVGNGLDQGSNFGPIQNRPQFERVKDLIADAKKNGLNFIAGGDLVEGKGYFIPISIVDNPPESSRVVQEEAFGPVLPLLKFKDVDEVIARVNASEYGLAGSVWTKDIELAKQIARRIETGTVWINHTMYIMPWTPFAGRKQSGLGVENGVEGLLEFTAPQTITVARQPQPA